MDNSELVATGELGGLAERINEAHAKCEATARTTVGHAIECGRLLARAKGAVPHGGWLKWLGQNTNVSARTAQVYMRAAAHADELLAKAQSAALLTLDGAMKLLSDPGIKRAAGAAESQPDADVDELKRLIAAMDTAAAAARPRLDAMSALLDRDDLPLSDVVAIQKDAVEIQNKMAELDLRAQRAAGRILNSLAHGRSPATPAESGVPDPTPTGISLAAPAPTFADDGAQRASA